MNALDPIRNLRAESVLKLTRPEDGEPSVHRWSQPEIDALTLAAAADRPLLVRGEPGTGKTQIARAVAQHLGWALISEVIHPRYEPQDLIWRFDAVRRLADANTPSAAGGAKLDDADYWEPGPLWRAFDWDSAHAYGSCRQEQRPEGHVILIDEVDKADSDLPNSLLEALGQRSFYIAGLRKKIGPLKDTSQRPLIIITTNEERELPPAFLRRCMVLNLKPAGDYGQWLVGRGAAHYDTELPSSDRSMSLKVIQAAADQLVADRRAADGAGLQPPGAAEFLDLLQALHRLAPRDEAEQLKQLEALSCYAYIKHVVSGEHTDALQQTRKAIPAVPAEPEA
jgi:MoxR-like ATPase